MMGQIYLNASSVVLWLGEEDQKSRKAFQIIDELSKPSLDDTLWVEHALQLGITNFENLGIPASRSDLDHNTWQSVSLSFSRILASMGCIPYSVNEEGVNSLKATFSPLGERKWWTRRWVLQEAINARDIVIVSGSQSISWERLNDCRAGLRLFAQPHHIFVEVVDVLDQPLTLEHLRHAVRLNEGRGLLSLQEAMCCFYGRNCSDPRDYIYALLNITTHTKASIIADYDKSVQEVFTEATKAMILETGDLMAILPAGNNNNSRNRWHGAPSWVPDWATSLTTNIRGLYNSAWGTNIDRTLFSNNDPTVLNLTGIFHDTIIFTTGLMFFSEETSIYQVMGQHPRELESTPYPTGGTWTDAYWRTLMRDAVPGLTERLTSNELPVYRSQFLSWSGRSSREADIQADAQPSDPLYSTTAFESIINISMDQCSFIITRKGFVGFVQGNAAIDDKVYIIHGSQIPLVIRPMGQMIDSYPSSKDQGKRRHHFVGGAYVHGIMDGEVIKEVEQRARVIESISLY